MALYKVLITVKTYPTPSSMRKEEVVCTAGVTEEGKWIRIYPIPFRRLEYAKQYKKYDIIEFDLKKNKKDFRPESFSPINIDSPDAIIKVGNISTAGDWEKRKQIVLTNVYTDLKELISEAKDSNKCTSLAVFKPTKIKNFIFTEESREWEPEKIQWLKQYNLFGDQKEIIRKLPYKFSYVFEDCNHYRSTLMVEDWELCALYWKLLKKYSADEKKTCEGVKQKYFHDFTAKKDLYFLLGTNFIQHLEKSRNPFIIIGLFYPPLTPQLKFDF